MYLFITVVLPFLLFFYHLSAPRNKRLIVIPMILAIAFSILAISLRTIGLVDGINFGGLDAPAYKEIYGNSGVGFKESINLQFYEKGYSVLVWLFSRYVGGYEIFQVFIYSYIFLVLYYYTLRLNRSYYSFLSLMLLMFLVVNSFNTLRVVFAVFVSLPILFLLSDRRYYSSLILFLFSLSLHVSSVVVFLFIFFHWLYSRFGFQVYSFFLISSISASVFLTLFFIPFLIGDGRLVAYAGQAGDISYGTIISVTVFLLLVSLRWNELHGLNRYNKAMVLFLCTFYIVVPVFYFYPIAYRLFLFYLPILYFLIPSVLVVYSPFKLRNIKFLPLWFAVIGYVFSRVYKFYSIEIYSAGEFLFGWFDFI